MSEKETKLFKATSVFNTLCGKENVKVTWFCVGRKEPVIEYDSIEHNITFVYKRTAEEYLNGFFLKEEYDSFSNFLYSMCHIEVDCEEVDIPLTSFGHEESGEPVDYVELTGIERMFPFKVWGRCALKDYPLTEYSEDLIDELAYFLLQKKTPQLGITETEMAEGLQKKVDLIYLFHEALKKKATAFLEDLEAVSTQRGCIKVYPDQIKKPF